MALSKVGRRGQVTIPKQIRKKISLREGDHVAFTLSDDRVIIEPVKKTLLDLRGSIEVSGPQDFSAIRKQVMAAQVKKGAEDDE